MSHPHVYLELSTLLPDHLLDSVPASSNVMSVTTGQSGANGKPINKGTILKLSVDHIREMKEEVNHCKERIRELEKMVEVAKQGGDFMKIKEENVFQENRARHERVGSIQFQQQFGKLHINHES